LPGFRVNEKYYLSNHVWSRGTDPAGRAKHSLRSFISAPIPATPYSQTLCVMLAGQMRQGINIKVISEPDDDGLYKYRISLSNGDTFASLDFWGYEDNFKIFGEGLLNFPKGQSDVITYELGEDKIGGPTNWAYYMLLKVSCLDPSGLSAIRIIVDNRADIPQYQRSEFYIKSLPSSLNKLGQRLKAWTPDKEKELSWDPDE